MAQPKIDAVFAQDLGEGDKLAYQSGVAASDPMDASPRSPFVNCRVVRSVTLNESTVTVTARYMMFPDNVETPGYTEDETLTMGRLDIVSLLAGDVNKLI